jgi:hypothetical protein
MTTKMKTILENLQQVIGEDTLHRFDEETTSAAVAAYPTPIGGRKFEMPVDEMEGESLVSKGGPKEVGGDPVFYGKETAASDADLKEGDEVKSPGMPKTDDPEGDAPLGKKPKANTEGDKENYEKEKKERDLNKIIERKQPAEFNWTEIQAQYEEIAKMTAVGIRAAQERNTTRNVNVMKTFLLQLSFLMEAMDIKDLAEDVRKLMDKIDQEIIL